MARIRHLADAMHRSYSSNGIAIASNWGTTADGAGNVVWAPIVNSVGANSSNYTSGIINFVAGSSIALGVSGQNITITNTGSGGGGGGGSVTYGSNATDVSTSSAVGASANVAREDHVHRGVRSIAAAGSNQQFGNINLIAGSNMAITSSGSNFTFASTATGGGGSVSFGSNATDVSSASAVGASANSAREDHVHRGLHLVTSNSSNTLYGDVNLSAGSGIALGVSGQTITLTNTRSAGGGGGGSSGALVLLEQHTASASATLDFTTAISSTYDDYLFELVQLIPATTNQELQLVMGTGAGPTWDTTVGHYNWWLWDHGGGGTFNIGNNADTHIRTIHDVNNTANWSASGNVWVRGPANGIYVGAQIQSFTRASDGNFYGFEGAGIYLQTTAVTGVRFLFASGNITSGTIRCYGLTK